MKKHIVFDCDGTLIDTSQFRYSLYAGVKELLQDLSADFKLYVWTARDRKSTLRILQELGVHELFEGFCTIDDAPAKPHILGLVELLGNTSKAEICMIGDTSNDILGAKNFGIKSIAAVWNTSAHAEIMQEMGADFVATTPEECLPWIRQNI